MGRSIQSLWLLAFRKPQNSKQMRRSRSKNYSLKKNWSRKNRSILANREETLKFPSKGALTNHCKSHIYHGCLLRLKKHQVSLLSLFSVSWALQHLPIVSELPQQRVYLLWRRIKNIYLFFTDTQGLLPQSEIGFAYTTGCPGKFGIQCYSAIQYISKLKGIAARWRSFLDCLLSKGGTLKTPSRCN